MKNLQKYNDVTYWFIFRSKDGKAETIEEIEGLIPALLAGGMINGYKLQGMVLTDIIASPNENFKGEVKAHDLVAGNA